MKTLILNGVPYNVNDTNQVFLYTKSAITSSKASSSSNAASAAAASGAGAGETIVPQVGTYDPSTGSLVLFENWEERSVEFLTSYRTNLHANTEDALEKARILQMS
jgi:hypothetical protein